MSNLELSCDLLKEKNKNLCILCILNLLILNN